MRVIAGTHRGRRLNPPKDQDATRPITDRVKENLFNRLMSLGAIPPPPPEVSRTEECDAHTGRVLDIFAGTGSLGLEALSRGANHCTFVETDRDALARLRQNIEALGESGRSAVVTTSALVPTWTHQLADGCLTVSFLDPPYVLADDPGAAQRLDDLFTLLLPKMEPGGVLVHRTRFDQSAPDRIGWDGPAGFTYGTMTLHFYQRPIDESES